MLPVKRSMGVTVQFLRLSKNRDEHGWNILQEVFRVRMLENRGVLLQLVSHLINDEAPSSAKASCVLRRSARFLSIFRMLKGIPETM